MGYFMTSIQLPDGASLDRTDKVVSQISERIKQIPEVENVIAVSGQSMMGGGSGSNMGSLFVVLTPWKDRAGHGKTADAIIGQVNEITASFQEPIAFSINPPAIPGLGNTSGMEMQVLDINNLGPTGLEQTLEAMKEAAQSDPRLAQLTTQFQGGVPQFSVTVDRDKAKMLGLALEDIYGTLSDYMGGSYVNDFVKFGRTYQVNISADEASRARIDDIPRLSVRNAEDEMVPFSSFVTVEPSMGEATVSRYNMYNSASITGTPAQGVSSSDAIKAMEEILDKTVGSRFAYAWTGEAYQESQSGTTISFVLIFAIVITILVLAAQYESWTDPIAVVISMPTAILGTVLGCLFMSQSISIYTQIGIILLLGLSAKNAILIVEYAIDYRKSGQSIRQAAHDAGVVRFRPIMMTAVAFVFGILPMLFATGAGAQSRVALGTAVVFGMAVNAIVGTLFVPGFWELLQRFKENHLSKLFASADQAADTPASDKTTDTASSASSDNTAV